jgi:pseudouridine synthase
MQNQPQRLDKFLANNGYESRRGIKQLLKSENVTVNGVRVKESGTRIVPEKDDVRINGQKVKGAKYVYYLLNKPMGIISTSADEYGRENVTDLIDTPHRVYPVGRLDKDTHGLILLTNDGELTHKVTHPRFHVPKTYHLKISGIITDAKIQRLRDGVILSDGITAPAKVNIVKSNIKETILEMEIYEGRYRQIRRMCDAIRVNLVDLKRIQFGPIKLGNLKEGKYRELTPAEVELLKKATFSNSPLTEKDKSIKKD